MILQLQIKDLIVGCFMLQNIRLISKHKTINYYIKFKEGQLKTVMAFLHSQNRGIKLDYKISVCT